VETYRDAVSELPTRAMRSDHHEQPPATGAKDAVGTGWVTGDGAGTRAACRDAVTGRRRMARLEKISWLI
jgi:hypothetical protein